MRSTPRRSRTISPWSGCASHASRRPSSSTHDQEALALERLDRARVGERFEHVDHHRLAEGEQLERLVLGRLEDLEAIGDQVDEAGRDGDRAGEAPHAVALLETADLGGAEHQLAQRERVAVADAPQLRERVRVDDATQRVDDQLVDLDVGERPDVDALGVAVLPEGGDGVAHLLPGADGDHDEHLTVRHDLEQQRRGGLVEQVGVVDEEQQALRNRPARPAPRVPRRAG